MRVILHSIATLLIALATPALADDASAPAWPQRPVTIVAPFQAGGSGDLIARLVQQQLQAAFGTSFLVENRSGAGGTIGTAYVAKAPNDGYTLLLGTFSTNVLDELVYGNVSYNTERDFEPVALLVRQPNLLVVRTTNPAKSVPEFIAYLKANDGKLNYGSSGIGTSSHLSAVMLQLATGTHATQVPFRSTADDVTNLMNGSIDFAIDSVTTLLPQAQGGAIRALAVSSEKRLPGAPDLPTIGETLKRYAVGSWQAILAPAGTPRPIIDKIAAALKEGFARPEIQSQLIKAGGEPTFMGPDELAAYIKSELPKWRDVVKASGVHID
jgi:tripartite-type tricarboxylate transporter receptor subunit TctC